MTDTREQTRAKVCLAFWQWAEENGIEDFSKIDDDFIEDLFIRFSEAAMGQIPMAELSAAGIVKS